MPFDGTETDFFTYAELSAVLRDRSRWPKGFEWNYKTCRTCAMGLAYRLKTGEWLYYNGHLATTKRMRAIITDGEAISLATFRRVFLGLHVFLDRAITPEDVADAIDLAIAE